MLRSLYLLPLVVFVLSCQQSVERVIVSDTTFSCSAITPETSECNSSFAVGSSPVTLSGQAQFFKRTINVGTYLTLAAPITTPLPIKFAEVRVLNSAGQIVQCGKTDSSGLLRALDGSSPLQIDSTPGNYTVQVLARSQHTFSGVSGKSDFKLYSSIKKDICTNEVHRLQKVVSSSGSGTLNIASSDLTAYARESQDSSVTGGAFNIHNNLVAAYTYLQQNTGQSDLTCLNPKLTVYWAAGFNPAQYIYTTEPPANVDQISFYLRGYNELYINGGKLGNVSTVDTDHFDDAVILHELGHRVEDACGKMDSPGGSHFGQYRIDPRLAWSEGWGNFFGAHIIQNSLSTINPELVTPLNSVGGWIYYLDTTRYADPATDSASNQLIRLTMTKPGHTPDTSSGGSGFFDKVDPTANPGEGHFREVSIARSLFKITNTCSGGLCTNTNYFPRIWSAFEKNPAGLGMGQENYPFRSSVRFFDRLNAVFAANAEGAMPAAIDATLNQDEALQRAPSSVYNSGGMSHWPAYGIKLVKNSPPTTACPIRMLPRRPGRFATNQFDDLRFSNHFYYIDLASTLSGLTEIRMTANKNSGLDFDFDLILLKESYRHPYDCTVTNPTCLSIGKNTSSSEIILQSRSLSNNENLTSFNTLGSSTKYLLNVRAFNSSINGSNSSTLDVSAADYTYYLTDQNGEHLCPATTF